MRRSRQEICADILKVLAVKGPLRPTPLAYKVKVNNHMLNQCLNYLCQQGFVEKKNVRNKVMYAATKKGWNIVKSVEIAPIPMKYHVQSKSSYSLSKAI